MLYKSFRLQSCLSSGVQINVGHLHFQKYIFVGIPGAAAGISGQTRRDNTD